MTNQTPRRHRRRWLLIVLGGALVLVLLCGIAFLGVGQSAKAQLAAEYPAPGELVNIGGYKLHLNCMGEGSPTVIMDAGNNDFSVTWATVQPEIAQFTQVCSYDRGGFGWSESSPYPRTSSVMVDELHTLLTQAGIEPPYVLIGHSFGGMNMRLFAHQYPDKTAGLVLVDSSHEEQEQRIEALANAVPDFVGQFETLGQMSTLGVLAMSPQDIPDRGLKGEALDQFRAILSTTGYFETAVSETQAISDSFAEVRNANITSLGDIPLVVLTRGLPDPIPGASEADNLAYENTWQELQAELAAQSTNSKQIIAEESDHYIQLRQPELVIEAVQEMVQEAK